MAACAALAAAPAAFAQAPAPPAAPATGVTLPGSVPALVSSSALLGPVMGVQPVPLALSLPLRSQNDLSDLLHDLYDVGSPRHGQFLTPQQFTDQFGPTQADYGAVVQYAQSKGLTVTGTNPTRTLVDVVGSAYTVGQAFGVHLQRYLDPSGREFYAPDADPTVDPSLSGKLVGVIGLDDAAVIQHATSQPPVTSPSGGLTPYGTKVAYNLTGVAASGAGQSLGVFELWNFTPGDIQTFENSYGIQNISMPVVAIDGGAQGTGGKNQEEVEGDIELQVGMAPGANQVIVYIAPLNYQGMVDLYSRIASDNQAREISTSWASEETVPSGRSDESSIPGSLVSAENTAFIQMAMQGQTIFASSGDNGVYANAHTPSVYDPASQPYVCGVGGTNLTIYSGGQRYSETAWQSTTMPTDPFSNDGGSGGGISANWPIPFYQSQSGVVTSASQGSYTRRNVPDVSLNATGPSYSIYWNGNWDTFSGTSAASPLWAGFAALVNQQRANNGLSPLGFINPYLYQIGRGGNYTNDFHDITTGSNGYSSSVPGYPAVTGYDDATGWGSFSGANLFADLSAISSPAPVPLPFYRLYWSQYNDHYYTTDIADAYSDTQNGFTYEGVQCHIYGGASDVPGLTPLYRLYDGSNHDHLLTTSSAEVSSAESGGYNYEGVRGYVFPDGNAAGTVPPYRAYNTSTGEHFYTTDYSDYSGRTSPWRQEGARAYVLP